MSEADLQSKIKSKNNLNSRHKTIERFIVDIEKDPANPEPHIKLADLYMKWHKDIRYSTDYLDEAITEYQKALELDVNTIEIYYKLGKALYLKGEIEKAIGYFEHCIKKDENHANAYFMRAKILAGKERIFEAIENVEKAIKHGKLKASRAHFLNYILLKPQAISYRQRMNAFNQLLWAFLKLPFDKRAVEELREKVCYVKFFPIVIKGFILEQRNFFNQAIELYKSAIEEAPGFLSLYVILGDCYRKIGQTENALHEYKMAVWLEPLNLVANRHLCDLYEELGNYDATIEIYEKLIKINPGEASYYSNLANIYYLKEDANSAIACYQAALNINPSNKWTSVIAQTVGYVFQETQKNYDAAISSYQNASVLNPNDTDIYVSLGSAYYDKGDYDNAMMIYRMALEKEPKNSRIHCNLGYLLWTKGDMDEAIKEYEKSIELNPCYDIAHNNLGVIYLDDLGMIKKSMEYFMNALEHNPNYALAYYNLARAFVILGDKLQAAKYFQAALDVNALTNELDENEVKNRLNNLFD